MGRFIEGREAARKSAMSSIDALEARIAGNIEAIVRETDRHIKSLTPVNTGQAVRNYIWTMGPGSSVTHDAIDSGDTGRTNKMALGTEPRRAANESAAAQSLSSINFSNPFGVITLTNNSPDIEGLELGIYPGPPLTPRSPNGMFGVTSKYISTLLSMKGIMS
jgi:hypothetical protein